MMANEMNQLPAGTRIANQRYEIAEVIGQGGFGITYRGYDRRLELPVAIKEYYPSGIASRYSTQSLNVQVGGEENRRAFDMGKKKFLEEARILARFSDDSNIVGVRDFFEDNQTVYIVMEYLQGESLNEYGKRVGPLPFERVYAMLRPVMESLSIIHKSGLIHRDISPSNLIRLRNGRTKLIDFGTAREVSPAGEKSLSVVLKPGYAPAEQYQSRGAQGPWSDVYALCASIYRLITGRVPENSLNRVMKDELAWPSGIGADISPAAESVLMQGMALQAGRRIQNMEQLMTEFDRALSARENAGDAVWEAGQGNDGTRSGLEEDEEKTVRGPVSASREEIPESSVRFAGSDDSENSRDSFAVAFSGERILGEKAGRREEEAGRERPSLGGRDKAKRRQTGLKGKEEAGREKEASEVKEKAGKGKKKKRKKIPGPALVLAGLVLVIISVCWWLLQPNTKNVETNYDGSKTASFKEITVTAADIKKVANDAKVTHLYFYRCQLDDEAVQTIGSIGHIKDIDFTSCTGFTTLSPLAGCKALRSLDISGLEYGEEGNQLLEGGAWFGEDFPQVERLTIDDYRLGEDLAFLGHFKGLTYLWIHAITGKVRGIFPEIASLQTLDVDEVDLSEADLSALGQCSLLEDVNLNRAGITNLSFLAGASALTRLSVVQNHLTRLEGLENHTSLTDLLADENELTDISALASCSSLSAFQANNNQIEDIAALASCPELTQLELGGNKIKDISSLNSSMKMKNLDLEDNQVEDISSLTGMTDLITLKISGNKVKDPQALRPCVGLLELEINRNEIKDLAFCEEMINLVRLEAGENEIADISGLHNATQLEDVRLAGNRITDGSVLVKSADKLKNLVLDKNPLKDIQAIGKCANLYALSLNECGLMDIKALAGCPNLYYLSAYGNKLTSIEGLESCAGLYALDIGENEIADLKGLEESSSGDMVLLLQNNKIKNLDDVNPMKNYIYLSIYGNQISDLTVLETMTNLKETSGVFTEESKVYMDWIDTMTGDKLAGIHFRNPNIVGVPLDRQVNVKNDFQEARKDSDWGSMYDEINYLTREEADEQIASIRKEARQQAGLEKAPDGEEAADETEPAGSEENTLSDQTDSRDDAGEEDGTSEAE